MTTRPPVHLTKHQLSTIQNQTQTWIRWKNSNQSHWTLQILVTPNNNELPNLHHFPDGTQNIPIPPQWQTEPIHGHMTNKPPN